MQARVGHGASDSRRPHVYVVTAEGRLVDRVAVVSVGPRSNNDAQDQVDNDTNNVWQSVKKCLDGEGVPFCATAIVMEPGAIPTATHKGVAKLPALPEWVQARTSSLRDGSSVLLRHAGVGLPGAASGCVAVGRVSGALSLAAPRQDEHVVVDLTAEDDGDGNHAEFEAGEEGEPAGPSVQNTEPVAVLPKHILWRGNVQKSRLNALARWVCYSHRVEGLDPECEARTQAALDLVHTLDTHSSHMDALPYRDSVAGDNAAARPSGTYDNHPR